jgi:hypothetical protein
MKTMLPMEGKNSMDIAFVPEDAIERSVTIA